METGTPPSLPTEPQPPQYQQPGVPMFPADYQEVKDAEHLKILSICHYVSAGLTLLYALFPLIYILMGGLMMTGGAASSGGGGSSSPDELIMMGGMFVVLGVVASLVLLVFAVLEFLAGQKIAERRWRVFCLIIAGVNCMSVPLGTVLGVFTIIVLLRPSVAAKFEQVAGAARVED